MFSAACGLSGRDPLYYFTVDLLSYFPTLPVRIYFSLLFCSPLKIRRNSAILQAYIFRLNHSFSSAACIIADCAGLSFSKPHYSMPYLQDNKNHSYFHALYIQNLSWLYQSGSYLFSRFSAIHYIV